MKGKVWLLAAALIAPVAAGAFAQSFDEIFTGATMRLDFYHTGTAGSETISLDRVRIEGPWPGSRTHLIDSSNLGKYFFEIVDLATQRVVFSHGFASIYGEWETTGEAGAGTVRTFAEALRFPEPRRAVQVRLRKRGADQAFREVWSVTETPDPVARTLAAPSPRPRPVILTNTSAMVGRRRPTACSRSRS